MAAVLPPVPPVPTEQLPFVIQDWLRQVRGMLTGAGSSGVLFTTLDFTSSNLTSILTRNHNDLQNIQGGTTSNYYHYQPGQVLGTSTNDNAAAGYVGEYISSTIATGSSVALTTGTAANITSISLTAGDWDVTGVIDFTPGATTTTTYLMGGISTTTNTIGAQDSYFANTFAIATTAVDAAEVCPMVRITVASGTTTVYLVAKAGFAISTLKAYGTIRARRVR